MAILGDDGYEWHLYQASRACALESARGQSGVLVKGAAFGVRGATSDPRVCRVILKELGPRTVFSLPRAQVEALLKKSRRLDPAELRPAPAAQRLARRLARADPKDFWSIVAALDWPKSSADPAYPQIARAALRERLRAQELARFGSAAARHRRALAKAVEGLEKRAGEQLFLGGDDSFYDALAHAVSSGQRAYEAFLRKPESFVKKYNRAPVHAENFDSCWL